MEFSRIAVDSQVKASLKKYVPPPPPPPRETAPGPPPRRIGGEFQTSTKPVNRVDSFDKPTPAESLIPSLPVDDTCPEEDYLRPTIQNETDGFYLAPSLGQGEEYENPDDMITETRGSRPSSFLQRASSTTTTKKQPKLVDTVTLRQTRAVLKPVDRIFRDTPREESETGDDPGNNAKRWDAQHVSPSFETKPPHQKTQPTVVRSFSQPPPLPRDAPNSHSRSSSVSSSTGSSVDFRGESVPVTTVRERITPPTQHQCERRIEDEPWYFNISRNETNEKLECKDGMFLVRPSKHGGIDCPYTLCVYCGTRVYNLNIRRRPDKTYALAKRRPDEQTFSSVSELIAYHRNNAITLIDKDNSSTVLLTDSPPEDVIYDQTW